MTNDCLVVRFVSNPFREITFYVFHGAIFWTLLLSIAIEEYLS